MKWWWILNHRIKEYTHWIIIICMYYVALSAEKYIQFYSIIIQNGEFCKRTYSVRPSENWLLLSCVENSIEAELKATWKKIPCIFVISEFFLLKFRSDNFRLTSGLKKVLLPEKFNPLFSVHTTIFFLIFFHEYTTHHTQCMITENMLAVTHTKWI